ncbi:uncharacterized protein BT62DRAFT_925414 [Guyanagaster necrorhizus]|uniref:Cytochrome b561 domain-containing protein n=1 Tax=Guyanagaster necrorhizus TaxID=856835 RepID=A0A9P7W5K2_9AGAR|nr:uncharacterized protein BT62DRAFT_925414 [Guyanagaster necrorhizus MCA 3950]KAG7452875.1 hypothetical protein BT62DRAFT_925414 [Guyanagaster necrorhizus MCA 3950]
MGYEEQLVKPEDRKGDALALYAAFGATGLFLLVSWITVLINDPTKVPWFSLHPTLQSLALSFIVYGILTLQPTSQPKTKAAGLSRHQLAIVVCAFPIVTIGTFAVWWNKHIRDHDHFTTWHGKLGLLCICWVLLQIAIGGGSVWFGGAVFGGGMKAKLIWRYHRISGYILFPLLLLTANFGGLYSNWGTKYLSLPIRVIVYAIAPPVILLAIYIRVRPSKMNIF